MLFGKGSALKYVLWKFPVIAQPTLRSTIDDQAAPSRGRTRIRGNRRTGLVGGAYPTRTVKIVGFTGTNYVVLDVPNHCPAPGNPFI